ncbi:C39 family peptidase [Parvimonas micra]|uniref:C39 family peptidase n=1 Tax=Parvimonas micra TaxID=33033 RepID=A0AAX3K6I1_9FIRM|nr:C39 family peptidase [Parvimonas micra]WBB30810.1 C39 family peptidase [Parvimonas micra]
MKVFKKVFLMFFSLLIFHLGFNSILFAENINENEKKLVYVENIFYDENGKFANGWYDDGTEWYFFKDGKKHTGFATDGNGKMYFKNGKYGTAYVDKIFYEEGKPANGWYDDGSDWYFFKNGKKYTGFATDGNGKMYFKDGKYGKGYVDKVFYGEGKPADWWYDDGTGWYFFQKGKKFTGIAKDTSGEKYFVDGKYGSGIYNDILYKDGIKSEGKVYVNGIFYGEDLKPANWWYDDGTGWYFFQKGKKHTGFATDGNGKMYFKDGKYGKGYVDKVFYGEGKPADWWYDDGTAWYFFQKGEKFTGIAKDTSGEKYFVDGKYGSGIYNDILYKDGVKSEGKVYVDGIFYGEDLKPANWWYDDGTGWYFFQKGKKHTGFATDGNGKMYFKDGKYGKGYVDKVFYGEGKPADWWYDDGTGWYFFQKGEKFTGIAKDASGEKYFVDGKYGSGIYNDILYKDGIKSEGKVYVNGIFYGEDLKPANWWYDDGTAWYFFQNGKKHTGFAKDASGEKYFVDGKYANGLYNEKLYKDGIETEGEVYINGLFFDKDKKLANGWYYDGIEELYFENGSKYTGVLEGKFLVDGKYANKYYDGKYYKDGEEIEIPDSMFIEEGIKAYNFDDDKYYTGCWLYSAASGLYSKGVSITPPELLKLLPNTGDPRTGVMGNPKEHLYQGVFPACYPSALVPVLKKFVPTIEDFSGASFEDIKFEDIKLQLSQGHTVQIWLSRVIPSNIINVGDGETIIASAWYHSVLLIGYNDKGFYHIEAVNQNKKVFLDFEKSLSQYEVFGRKAILYK